MVIPSAPALCDIKMCPLIHSRKLIPYLSVKNKWLTIKNLAILFEEC